MTPEGSQPNKLELPTSNSPREFVSKLRQAIPDMDIITLFYLTAGDIVFSTARLLKDNDPIRFSAHYFNDLLIATSAYNLQPSEQSGRIRKLVAYGTALAGTAATTAVHLGNSEAILPALGIAAAGIVVNGAQALISRDIRRQLRN